MPEPEALGRKFSESRCYGWRPGIRADCSAAEPLRSCRQSVRFGFIKCRYEQKRTRIGIEIAEPRSESSLEPRRQRKCLESGRGLELKTASRDWELGQG
jgi:hypothetical protein